GAVNTVVRRGGRLDGETTDGDGLLAALRFDEGWDPAGRRCLLLGTGGAARAVALGLGRAGASQLLSPARRREMAASTPLLAGPAGEIGTVEQADSVDTIINATPVGMAAMPRVSDGPVPPPDDLDAARHRGLPPGDLDAARQRALPLGIDPARMGSDQLV